jgi:WD40 repeat protein
MTNLMKKRLPNRNTWLIVLTGLALLIGACQPQTPEPMPTSSTTLTPTRQASPTTAKTLTLPPTGSATAASTPTRTASPSPTTSPTPTPTSRWDEQSIVLTPLSPSSAAIGTDNTHLIQPLAVWGTGRINDLVFSPDGLILAAVTPIGVYFYDSLSYEIQTLYQTPYPAQTLIFSKNKDWAAIGQSDGSIDIIEYDTSTLIARLQPTGLEGATMTGFRLHFSDIEDALIAVYKTIGQIHTRIWTTETWQIEAASEITSGLSWFFNPRAGLVGSLFGQTLNLESVYDPEEKQTLPLPTDIAEDFLVALTYSDNETTTAHNGEFLLINNGMDVVRWDLNHDHLTYQLSFFETYLTNPCTQAAASCMTPDNTIAWGCGDGPGTPPITALALTQDDIMFMVSFKTGGTQFRRASDGDLAWEIKANFTRILFSYGGDFFYGLRPDGTLEKRTTLDGALIEFIEQHPEPLYDLAFSPDSSALAAAYGDAWIRVYQTQTGQMLGVLNGTASALSFSPDGQLLAAGLIDGTVRIFRLLKGDFYDLPKRHQDRITDLSFSDNGVYLLSGSKDCTARLWQVESRYQITTINPGAPEPFQISQVGILPEDQRLVITGSRSGIFTFVNNSPAGIILDTVYGFNDLALGGFGRFLAVTGAQTFLVTYDPQTKFGTPKALDAGLAPEGYALAFSPDSSLLILSTIQDLEFWQVPDGQLLGHLNIYSATTPNARPVDLEMAPNGQIIALATHDSLIHIYGIANSP